MMSADQPNNSAEKKKKWGLISKNFKRIIWHIYFAVKLSLGRKKKRQSFSFPRKWAVWWGSLQTELGPRRFCPSQFILPFFLLWSFLNKLPAFTAPSLPAFVFKSSTHSPVTSDTVDQDGHCASARESSQERRWDVNVLRTLTPSACGLSNIGNLRWFSSRHLPLSSVQ